MTTKQQDVLRRAVREALDGTLLTRDELVAAVIAQRGLEHVGEALRSGWGTLLKPLAWQGDLCFGPTRGNRVTFMRPEAASSRWAGIPDPDEAASAAMVAYFRAYGPATVDAFGNWLAGGWFGKRQLQTWFSALGNRLAEVEVDGERAHLLAEASTSWPRRGPPPRCGCCRVSISTYSVQARPTATSCRQRGGPR